MDSLKLVDFFLDFMKNSKQIVVLENGVYTIELSRNARKAYLKLPNSTRTAIHQKLQKLAEDPYQLGQDIKKLQGIESCYRLRVNDYRVLYQLNNHVLIIEVIKIAHRKEVYQ